MTEPDADHALASDEEMEKIKDLRAELATEFEELKRQGYDYPHTTGDIWLLRVLRGNEGTVSKAAVWYRKSLAVRKQYGCDEMFQAVKDKPYNISELPGSAKASKYFTSFSDEASLRTPDGDLLHCDVPGVAQWEKFMEEMSLDAYLQWQMHIQECKLVALDRLSREEGRLVKVVVVSDLTGMRLPPKPLLALEKDIKANIYESTGIEIIHRVFFLGAPRFFHGIYRLARPMLPVRTREKVTVFGRNYAEDPEVVRLAGKPLLARLLATHHAEEEALQGQMRMVTAGGVLERSLGVSPGQQLCWSFRVGGQEDLAAAKARGRVGSMMDVVSSGTDLFFEITAVWDDDGDAGDSEQTGLVQLVAPANFDASGEEVRGSVTIERSGTAILKWTNAHSWVRAKVLAEFEIRVEAGEETAGSG